MGNANDPAGSSAVTLIEWRHSGHRLSYVRAIVDAATKRGIDLQIITQPTAVESDEWHVHLGDIDNLIVTTLAPESFHARHLPALLRDQRRRGRLVILPEVDRVLHAVVLALFTRQLPRRTTVIAMRPPKWSSSRNWLKSVGKVVALRCLAATRSVNVLLLEDPLASTQTRVWKWPLGASALRLDDPADPSGEGGDLPPELIGLRDDTKLIALTGMIDDRKQAPLILDGWASRPEDPDCMLIVAGFQQPTVRRTLADHISARRGDVLFIDRYLSTEELGALIKRSTALFVLFDDGFSSGTLINAARAGRWAITSAGGRSAKVGAEHGFGIVSQLTPEEIRRSIDIALAKIFPPAMVAVSGRSAFGDRVLRTTLSRNGYHPLAAPLHGSIT